MARLARELRDTQNNEDLGASVGLENDDDLFLWNVTFEGPEDSLYEVSHATRHRLIEIESLMRHFDFTQGGYFKTQLRFPQDYPNSPPEMRFVCPMWHPNSKYIVIPLSHTLIPTVYEDGKVCISILHAPGEDAMSGESAEERWRPILSVEAILLSVISMMNDPNIHSPANIDASVQYRDNR